MSSQIQPELTANAELSISRDLMRVDALLLGPALGTPETNAYTETRVPLCLDLPDGWVIARSRCGGWECYDGDRRIELAVHNITRSGRIIRNWFWAGGSRWVVYVCGSSPWYMSQTIAVSTSVIDDDPDAIIVPELEPLDNSAPAGWICRGCGVPLSGPSDDHDCKEV